ncbi:MAG TPA: hypothetical protein VFG83_01270 [Kofleriaceae bacterium]|nr:hypothetical protein [Kofleriaceae bacterium]
MERIDTEHPERGSGGGLRERERYRREELRGQRQRGIEAPKGTHGTAALVGGAAAVLAILGLIGLIPSFMAAIATIVAGAALLMVGRAVAARYSRIRAATNGHAYRKADVAGGMSAEVLGGGAGIVLGILALLGALPTVLLPIAAIALGGGLLLGGAARAELAEMEHGETAVKAAKGAGGGMGLAGGAAVVLGILVLAKVGTPLMLVLVSMIVVGGAILLGGMLAARAAR